jgi:hypothetical protein
MLASLRTASALLAAFLCLLLATCASASAGTPATVTVRVLGPAPNYEPLTPLTQVTTTTTEVSRDGGACSGTSAAGALELATRGNWAGTWNSEYADYEITSIDERSYPFGKDLPYWSFWLNNAEASKGVCEAELEAGDQVLFFPQCYSSEECPSASSVLGVEAPATVEVDKPVTVTVRSYPRNGGAATALAGATVGGGGTSAETNSEGHATLVLSGDGTFTVRATGAAGEEPRAVPGETIICAHAGNDGTCGTVVPAGSPLLQPTAGGPTPRAPYTGSYALVAGATGIREGEVYSRSDAPRTLSGKVVTQASVTSISLRLRRAYGGDCWAYDGSRERLERVRCGHGSFFKIASGGDSFSYLLPSRLPPGRYVLDIQAVDSAGNHTALDRGSSRIVFYVK